MSGSRMAQEEEEEGRSSLEDRFTAAARVMRSLPEDGTFQPSEDMMLMFGSYYQQATVGPCTIPRPTGFWDTRGKARWDAWSSLGNMTKEEAMMNYVDDIQLILETIPISDEVSDLVEKLGNFYAEVEEGGEEEEGNEADRRSFTRPFAKHAGELRKPFETAVMEGFGDLWDDIQNPQEYGREGNVAGLTVSRGETEGREENGKMERTEESSESEEEESGGEDRTDDEEEEESGGEDRTDDEEEEEVKEKEWRSPDPSESVEPSMSSITNGTHSSLNSEVEEEELAFFIEPTSHRHLSGHLSDHGDAFPEKSHRATDSDNKESCDSMERLAVEEGTGPSKVQSPGSRAASVRRKHLWVESRMTLNGGEDQTVIEEPRLEEGTNGAQHNRSWSRRGRGSQSPRAASSCGSQLCVDVEAACDCVSGSRRSISAGRGSIVITEQIATALLRLQEDMSRVLHRLNTLEALTVSQSRSPSPRQEDSLPLARKRLFWWPFPMSPVTVVLSTVWPLIARWLVHLYLQRKRRKIS